MHRLGELHNLNPRAALLAVKNGRMAAGSNAPRQVPAVILGRVVLGAADFQPRPGLRDRDGGQPPDEI